MWSLFFSSHCSVIFKMTISVFDSMVDTYYSTRIWTWNKTTIVNIIPWRSGNILIYLMILNNSVFDLRATTYYSTRIWIWITNTNINSIPRRRCNILDFSIVLLISVFRSMMNYIRLTLYVDLDDYN